MSCLRPLLLFLFISLSAFPATGRGEAIDRNEPPVVDQPLDFERTGGAVGPSFRVSTRIRPGDLEVDKVAILTVRIQSVGRVARPPKRPRLWELKPFAALEKKGWLKIDRPEKKKADKPERTPDAQTWEYDYQVKALSDSLKHIPAFPFIYYKPPPSDLVPGQFPTTFTEPVPVQVKAKPGPPALPPPPIKAPEMVFELAEGSAVLARHETARLPSWPVLLLVLLAPPIIAVDGYLLWRYLNPDAARRARIRQSLAARQALNALHALGPADPDQRAYRVARIAAGYLQQRLGLPSAEPTPAEVTACLARAGSPEALAGKAAEFFRACDAARFAPAKPAEATDLAAAATRLIQTLEAETWAGN
jgi:hypothetical protein